jgi:hypothetical protein
MNKLNAMLIGELPFRTTMLRKDVNDVTNKSDNEFVIRVTEKNCCFSFGGFSISFSVELPNGFSSLNFECVQKAESSKEIVEID